MRKEVQLHNRGEGSILLGYRDVLTLCHLLGGSRTDVASTTWPYQAHISFRGCSSSMIVFMICALLCT